MPTTPSPTVNQATSSKVSLAADIIRLVSSIYDTPTADILGTSIDRRATQPRQVVAFLLHESGFTLQEIADAIHRKDHGTARHSIRRINNLRDTRINFAALLRILLRETKALTSS